MIEEPEGTLLAEGHVATLDFVGRTDGKPFQGGSGQGVELEIGSGQFIPGFEEQLVGALSGEDREVTVSFPEDYGAEQLAGRTADFHVTARRVETQKLPELDEEFCSAFGISEGGVEKLREEVLDSMRRELEQTVHGRMKEQVMQGLLDEIGFDQNNEPIMRATSYFRDDLLRFRLIRRRSGA